MITTVGEIMLHEALPENVRPTGPMNKGGLSKLLRAVADLHPKDYGTIVGAIKTIGNHAAYESGTSFTLADFKPHAAARDAAFAAHQPELDALHAVTDATPALQHDPAHQGRVASVHARIEEHVNQGVAQRIHDAPNDLTAWVASGARGDAATARQMVAMAGMNIDVTNKLVPGIARRSFSEGLSPIDFHIHANGARRGVVNTYTSVREPGAFAKELNTLTMDMVVTQADCGTTQGVVLPPGHPDALDRCLAQDVPGIAHRNDIWTPALAEAAKKLNGTKPAFRSPLHCQAHEGVCARCYGLNEAGRMPPVGEHVGLRASQALTEPLTQLALNTKHTGGVVGAGKSPFQQIMQVMHAPKNFSGVAVLAQRDGPVKAIEAAAAGGSHVTIGDVRHYVAPDRQLQVKLGDVLRRGSVLTDGTPHPAEVVQHMGMEAGRAYFAGKLQQLYGDAGIRGHGKIFETIARSVLNLGQVVHAGDSELMPGEVVNWNSVAAQVDAARIQTVPIAQAQGRILASPAGNLDRYQVVSPKAAGDLQRKGVNQVHVYAPDALVIKPMMLGTERAAMHKGDWMASLGYRFIGSQFKENVAAAASADIHSWNPIAAYAYGAEFGRGAEGRY